MAMQFGPLEKHIRRIRLMTRMDERAAVAVTVGRNSREVYIVARANTMSAFVVALCRQRGSYRVGSQICVKPTGGKLKSFRV